VTCFKRVPAEMEIFYFLFALFIVTLPGVTSTQTIMYTREVLMGLRWSCLVGRDLSHTWLDKNLMKDLSFETRENFGKP